MSGTVDVPDAPDSSAAARAASVARASYGRLVAILAARSGDITEAEDALSEALLAALRVWPERGIPSNPEGWLVTAARNRMTDTYRRALKQGLEQEPESAMDTTPQNDTAIPDPRLALMFVCAHPAIAPAARTPLMLQTVLGFSAHDIARAYMLSPATLSQTLVRAKKRIKANAIAFRVPEVDELPTRLIDVLEAIYGAYSLGWIDSIDARDMQREAVFLSDLLAGLLPDQPEVLGLSALLGLLHARRDARLVDGQFVPLDEQDTGLWDHDLTNASLARLGSAHALGRIGRFQIEAAIQAVHADRTRTGQTDWKALAALHSGLKTIAPTLGAQVSHAAVVARCDGAKAGLTLLDTIPETERLGFQPWWATRAHLLAEMGQAAAAAEAYEQAIALTRNPAHSNWLTSRKARLPQH